MNSPLWPPTAPPAPWRSLQDMIAKGIVPSTGELLALLQQIGAVTTATMIQTGQGLTGGPLPDSAEIRLADIPPKHVLANMGDIVAPPVPTPADNLGWVRSEREVRAGTGLEGGGDLSADRTIALRAINPTGEGIRPTVDSFGRVTELSPLLNEDVIDALGYAPPAIFANLTALQDYHGSALTALVNSRSVFGDRGGGPFAVKPGDNITPHDGAMVIVDALGRRWWRVWSGDRNLACWGAKGDSTNGTDGTDNSAAIQAAIDSIPLGGTEQIRVDPGFYRIDTPPTMNGRFPTFLLNGARFTAGKFTLACQRLAPFSINFDNANIRVGSNDAGLGRGALMIGGADPSENGNGTYLVNDGHPNWLIAQSSMRFGPTELNVYGSGTGGVATSDGSDTLTTSDDSVFTNVMIGHEFWFDGTAYKVLSVPAFDMVQLNASVPAKTSTWNFVLTTASGTCSISGTSIRRKTGEPYIPFTTLPSFVFTVGGIPIPVTWASADEYIADSPPGDTDNAEWFFSLDINRQIATGRWQKTAGASEENVNIYATPFCYRAGAQASGFGKLWPWYFTSEYQDVMELAAYGKYVSLGGVSGGEAARFLYTANAVNRLDIIGGPSGFATGLRAAGSDANVATFVDTKGAGNFTVSSHGFGAIELVVFGAGGTSYFGIGSSLFDAPELSAIGASANIDIALTPKGSGRVRVGPWTSNADTSINGFVEVKDNLGNVRKVATIS